MQWVHKGIRFHITFEPMGPLCLAAARSPETGPLVRVRPFSAVGTSQEHALQLLKEQIEREFRKVPDSRTKG